MKVNIHKVYDTVNWRFHQELLKAYKFPQPFVQCITTYVKTVSYSLLINGEPTEVFSGQGLGQGSFP